MLPLLKISIAKKNPLTFKILKQGTNKCYFKFQFCHMNSFLNKVYYPNFLSLFFRYTLN